MADNQEETGGTILKLVEAIAISPQDARAVIKQYDGQLRQTGTSLSDEAIRNLIIKKVISRYSRLAATSGGVTSLAGVVPGVGTAVTMIGGGLADVSICMKLQIDMTMCLAVAINDKITNEDAKHMSFIIALAGTLEKFGAEAGKTTVSKAAVKVASKYLSGPTLISIKQLFKQVGIEFTKKATTKAIPFGIGVALGSGANYFLTRYVGAVARDVLLLESTKFKAI